MATDINSDQSTAGRPDASHIPLSRVTGVIVVTDDSRNDPEILAAHDAAAALAGAEHVPLVLYDRAEETWADTQHPQGPLEIDDDRLAGRDALREQMQRVARAGVRPLAWVATLPSISAVQTAAVDVPANVVIVPQALSRKFLERALSGTSLASELRAFLDRNSTKEIAVLESDEQGDLSVVLSVVGD